MVTLGSPLLHNPSLAAGVTDDGLKKMGLGTLTLDKTSTYPAHERSGWRAAAVYSDRDQRHRHGQRRRDAHQCGPERNL